MKQEIKCALILDLRGILYMIKEVLDYIIKLCFNNPLITKEECLKHVKGYKIIKN